MLACGAPCICDLLLVCTVGVFVRSSMLRAFVPPLSPFRGTCAALSRQPNKAASLLFGHSGAWKPAQPTRPVRPSVCCALFYTGGQRQFTRRKQDAVCIQGGDYKRPEPANTPCACTAADVECDYGYVAGSDGTCKALPQVCDFCVGGCVKHFKLHPAMCGWLCTQEDRTGLGCNQQYMLVCVSAYVYIACLGPGCVLLIRGKSRCVQRSGIS